jgi:hypothetical protein
MILLACLAAIGFMTGGTATADEVEPMAWPTCNATAGNLVGSCRNGNYVELDIYWGGADGTNCAYLRHGSSAPGGRINTFVDLLTCTTSASGAYCDWPALRGSAGGGGRGGGGGWGWGGGGGGPPPPPPQRRVDSLSVARFGCGYRHAELAVRSTAAADPVAGSRG